VSGVKRELNVGQSGSTASIFRDDGGGQADAIAGVDAVGEAQGRDTARVTSSWTAAIAHSFIADERRTSLMQPRAAGPRTAVPCRAGVCSTCRTKVSLVKWRWPKTTRSRTGTEQGYVLACQSRVKTPTLELDYDEK